MLRANVIESPITNASLQASAAAGYYVGVALAGTYLFGNLRPLANTISCALLDFLLSQKQCCDFLSQPLLHRRNFTCNIIMCTIIVFSLSNSACVICRLMPEATLSEHDKSLRMVHMSNRQILMQFHLIIIGVR